jgi:hypothetical protein
VSYIKKTHIRVDCAGGLHTGKKKATSRS